MTPEGKVVRAIRRAVKEAGGTVRKCAWEAVRGAPDLFIMLDGRHAWVEAKAPGGKLAPHQEREIARMRDAGCAVYVIDHEGLAHWLVEELKGGGHEGI